MSIEHRGHQGIELRAVEGQALPMIRGMPIVFNRLSLPLGFGGYKFRERVMPSFAESLAGADLRALVDHDGGKVIGRTTAGTLRVQVQADGVAVEIDPPDTSAGRDVVESIRRGDIDGMSFGFDNARDEWEDGEDGERIRNLIGGETLEFSVVAFPAYPDTSVAVRSLERRLQRDHEAARRRMRMRLRLETA